MSEERSSSSNTIYLKHMQKFMHYLSGIENSSYTQADLLEIRPIHIASYMNYITYGTETPGEHDRPKYFRSNTLAYIKKSLSKFMPRKGIIWDPVTNCGNPTRSEEVNAVIKGVKKFEVRHQGVQSTSTRPIEYDELLSILKVIHTCPDSEKRHMVCCALALQWHLIARVDDMMKLQFSNLSYNVQHPFTLLTKLRWSKNISEEREAPDQIVMGSFNPLLCPILNLAIYVETKAKHSSFVFGNPKHGARIVRSAIQTALNDDKFVKIKEGKILTHSFRKGAATHASRAGAVRDHVDRRGRWRRKKSTVDIYIDMNLPYPDALVAATLTGPAGPCKYKVNPNVQYLSEHVLEGFAENAVSVLPRPVARELAKGLIWATMESHEQDTPILPQNLREKIREKLARITELTENPISRIPIYVNGEGDQMYLVEASNTEIENSGADFSNSARFLSQTSDRGHVVALTSNVLGIKRRMEEMYNATQGEIHRLRVEMTQQFARLQQNVARIAIQPVVRSRTIETSSTNLLEPEISRMQRKLLGTPKNLYDLWKEYEFGLGNKKPAKCFTSQERGKCRSSYSRRKIFWDVIENMVRKGYTSDVAIAKTYLVYGQRNSVNTILLQMRAERKNGGHPELR